MRATRAQQRAGRLETLLAECKTRCTMLNVALHLARCNDPYRAEALWNAELRFHFPPDKQHGARAKAFAMAGITPPAP